MENYDEDIIKVDKTEHDVDAIFDEIHNYDTNNDITNTIEKECKNNTYEEYAFRSKIMQINNLPELCNSCGVHIDKHKNKQHVFIQINKDDRCTYCGCFFFEHSHSFELSKIKTNFLQNHPYFKIKFAKYN